MKAIQRLAEGLIYAQACRERSHRVAEEGRRRSQVGTCAPRRGHRRRGTSATQRSALGSKRFEPYIGHPTSKVQNQEDGAPLSGFENQWASQEDCKKLRLPSRRVCARVFTPCERQRNPTKPAQGSGRFPQLPQRLLQPTPGACSSPSCPGAAPRGAKVEESGLLCGMESAWTQHSM